MLAIEIFLPGMIMATQSETSAMGRHDGKSLGTMMLASWFVDLGKFIKPQEASYLTSVSKAEKQGG